LKRILPIVFGGEMNEEQTFGDYIVMDANKKDKGEMGAQRKEKEQVLFNRRMDKLFGIKQRVTLSLKEHN